MRTIQTLLLLAAACLGFAADQLGIGPVPTNATLLTPGPIGSTTSFTVTSSNPLDTSTVAWLLVEPAP
jgi:hypothetical protein